MNSVPYKFTDVKNVLNGTFGPGRGGRSMLKSKPSTLSALSGRDVPFFVPPHLQDGGAYEEKSRILKVGNPDRVKAKNFGGEALSEGASPLPCPLTSLVNPYRHISASHQKNAVYRAFTEAGANDKAESFMRCGEDVYILECERCGHRHKVQYNCKLRVCRTCAGVKMAAHMKKYLPYVLSMKAGDIRSGMLSIKNVDDLKKGVQRIRRCFANLRHRKYYKARILGGVYGLEAKPGYDGKWNVHLHFLYHGKFIPQARLSDDWKEITKGSFIVWIGRHEDPRHALQEAIKYVTKGVQPDDAQWTAKSLVEFVMALSDVRMVQAFGSFLGEAAEKAPFACPECGYLFWRRLSLKGGVILSYEEESVLREFRRTRPPPSVSLTWKRGLW